MSDEVQTLLEEAEERLDRSLRDVRAASYLEATDRILTLIERHNADLARKTQALLMSEPNTPERAARIAATHVAQETLLALADEIKTDWLLDYEGLKESLR